MQVAVVVWTVFSPRFPARHRTRVPSTASVDVRSIEEPNEGLPSVHRLGAEHSHGCHRSHLDRATGLGALDAQGPVGHSPSVVHFARSVRNAPSVARHEAC